MMEQEGAREMGKETSIAASQDARDFVRSILISCNIEGPAMAQCPAEPAEGPEDFSKFSEGLGLKRPTVEALIRLASSLGKDRVDVETLSLFFGGQEHIDACLLSLADSGLGEQAVDMLVFSHTLVPVTVIRTGERPEVEYQGSDRNITLSNIDPGEIPLEAGAKVLVHLGMVVLGNPSEALWEKLLELQAGNQEFREICRRLEKVDCANLASLFTAIGKMQSHR